MKCIKVTVFKYFQTVGIYSTKCFLFSPKCTKFVSVWGLRPRPRWGSLQRSPRPPSWIWLGSRRAPTENFWSNPPFQNPGYGPGTVVDLLDLYSEHLENLMCKYADKLTTMNKVHLKSSLVRSYSNNIKSSSSLNGLD